MKNNQIEDLLDKKKFSLSTVARATHGMVTYAPRLKSYLERKAIKQPYNQWKENATPSKPTSYIDKVYGATFFSYFQ
jgi:hypothetical protein